MDIPSILQSIRPGETWELIGDEYDGLVWTDTTKKPTLDELTKAWPEVERNNAFSSLRARRNVLLAESDWTQAADAVVDKVAWAAYRQQLRDLPKTTKDPANVKWPVPPS